MFHMAVNVSRNDEIEKVDALSCDYILVRLQFLDNVEDEQDVLSKLRSWCRRCCNLGDFLEFTSTHDFEISKSDKNGKRFVILNISSLEDANHSVLVHNVRCWSMKKCQTFQEKWLGLCFERRRERSRQKASLPKEQNVDCSGKGHHSSSVPKRQQGEILTEFLLRVITDKIFREYSDISIDESRLIAINQLNSGTGVIDAAGGSGHVSMALGIAGIKSTVVDPRKAVGNLPSRDRKFWQRSLRLQRDGTSNAGNMTCVPCNSSTVPYSAIRAWFGNPPDGVNASYRHPDSDVIEVCNLQHELVQNCSAIVALHPDEATDAIVSVAIQRKVPFVIVPCCVFARLFPNRKMKSGKNVSSYSDLLDYISAKDSSIQRTKLDFDGANIALWSIF